ncbi:MAG: ABC transporter permease, partial [Holophagales bacterium]|nr:ABC transporter permease [Holophagales bacterium]
MSIRATRFRLPYVRLRAQIVKELLSTLRDPRARFVLIGPPLLQLFVFSYAATLDVRNVNVAVLDLDRGAAAHELVQRLEHAWFVDRLERVGSLADLEARLDSQEALMALHIPSTFSGDAASGRTARAQLLLDGRRASSAQIAASYTGSIVRELSIDLGGVPAPVETLVRHGFNPNLLYVWFIVPSLSGILAMFISLLVTALSIARERELGTFDQLLVSPATSLEIIVAKTVPAVIVGSLLALLMVAAGIFVFRIPFAGSFPLLFGSLVLFISSIVGVGLMLSSVCRTQQQAILGTFTIGIPTVLISGFATPVENMPRALQGLAELSPLKHFLIIAQGSFLKALPPREVLANAWP